MTKEIDKNSEEWRRICEAKHALQMNNDHRQAYYEGVKARRGQNAVNELIAEVNKQRRRMRSQEMAP